MCIKNKIYAILSILALVTVAVTRTPFWITVQQCSTISSIQPRRWVQRKKESNQLRYRIGVVLWDRAQLKSHSPWYCRRSLDRVNKQMSKTPMNGKSPNHRRWLRSRRVATRRGITAFARPLLETNFSSRIILSEMRWSLDDLGIRAIICIR